MKSVCGYSQMQVLNASTVVLTSPLVFRYMLALSVPNLVRSFPPCFVPSASPLLFPILPFRSLFLPLCLCISKAPSSFVLISGEEQGYVVVVYP